MTRNVLDRVLWIGGAPDAGKTSVARALARRYGSLRYEYDRADRRHHALLARQSAEYRAFLAASLDERWVSPTPDELVARAEASFRDRFPLVLDDLAVLRAVPYAPIVVEGFGLTPALVAPHLRSSHQGIWLVPTRRFREESWERREKPAFAANTNDPERAAANLRERDEQLTARVREDARAHRLALLEVDGSLALEELVDRVAEHFEPYLHERRGEE